jgi:hypothetical protein
MFELRDYQVELAEKGLQILKKHGLVYYSIQVRCGKTLISLQTAKLYGAKRVLFFTRLKAISSIQKDFKALNPGFDLFVTNYDQAHNVDNSGFDLVILDEAHNISAFPKPAVRAKEVKRICTGLPIIYLSGTPTSESWSQIFHQLWVSSFSPFAEYTNFYKWANDGFVKIIKKMYNGVQINDYSKANKDKIDEWTKHLFISYSQEQAGFIEEVQEQVIHVKMQSSTYALATKLLKDRVFVSRKSNQEVVADTAVKLQQKLHQIYSGTVICESGEAMVFDRSKAEYIRDNFGGKKIAIFYVFRAEYIMLKSIFCERLTEDIDEFNSNPDSIIALQIVSGSQGTNLSAADCLIYLNIHFSNLQYWQSRARLQHLDRDTPVMLYWLFAENGIEDRILKVVQGKKDYVLSYFTKDFNVQPIKKIA